MLCKQCLHLVTVDWRHRDVPRSNWQPSAPHATASSSHHALVGWFTTHQGHEQGFLLAIQLAWLTRTREFHQGPVQAYLRIQFTDALYRRRATLQGGADLGVGVSSVGL